MNLKQLFFIVILSVITSAVVATSNRGISSFKKRLWANKDNKTPPYTLIEDIYWQTTIVNNKGKEVIRLPYGCIEPLPDGNFVGRQDSFLVKFNSRLEVLWRILVQPEVHHCISVSENGNIYLLSSDDHEFMGLMVRFDVVKVFDTQGTLIYKWCVYDHLQDFLSLVSESEWLKHLPVKYEQAASVKDYILQDLGRFIVPTDATCNSDFEFTHFTSLQVIENSELQEKIPAFTKGNILLCFNPYSSYGILNPHLNKIEWINYLPERCRLHSPTLTNQGTILIFQNSTDSVVWEGKRCSDSLKTVFQQLSNGHPVLPNPAARNWSSITEYNLVTNEKIWEYTTDPREVMRVPHMGSAQRLDNGNILISTATRKEGGMAFEITAAKKIVWTYIPQEKDPDNGLPIGLYRAKRFNPDVIKLIKGKQHNKK